MALSPNEIYRDYVVPGLPSSGNWTPPKSDIRDLLNAYRTVATTNVIYYVSALGNDANPGTSGAPFKTINKALEVIYLLDMKLNFATVKVSSGTYNEALVVSGMPPWATAFTRLYPVYIEGNTTTPSSVVLNGGLLALSGAKIGISGFSIASLTNGLHAVEADGAGSEVYTGVIDWGQMSSIGDHLKATDGGAWFIVGNQTVSGGAFNHWHVTEGSHARAGSGLTTTLMGTPAFTGQFVSVASSDLMMIGHTISGLATGRRFLTHLGGIIRSGLNNRTSFPGNQAGYEQSGGRLDEGSRFSVRRIAGSGAQSISAATWTKVFWNQYDWNVGADFDFTGNRYFARGGIVSLSAQITFNTIEANQPIGIAIWKNGAVLKESLRVVTSTGNPQAVSINLIDKADPAGDINAYYEVYAYAGGTGTKTISDSPNWGWFMGHNL